MTKTFRYEKSEKLIMKPLYSGTGDVDFDWESETKIINYTPSDEEFKKAVVQVVAEYYFDEFVKQTDWTEFLERVELLIDQNNMLGSLSEAFDKELHNCFHDIAVKE